MDPYPFHKDISNEDHLTGAYIVIRGWDPSCIGADVYKVQAKYRIMNHKVEHDAKSVAGVGVFRRLSYFPCRGYLKAAAANFTISF